VLLIFFGFCLCAFELDAQEWEGARIFYASGKDFAVSLRGEQTVFPVAAVGGKGIVINRSGIVHTGPETFLEIQLIPSGTVIKVAENSSLVYNGLDEAGKFEDLGLLYGKIRVVTGNDVNFLVLRSGGISAMLYKGDFAVSCLIDKIEANSTPRPIFTVDVIRGRAETFISGSGESSASLGGISSMAANSGESLLLDVSSFHTFAGKRPVGDETLMFWRLHNFVGTAPRAMPDIQIAIERRFAENAAN
jgi:hypothetical protein